MREKSGQSEKGRRHVEERGMNRQRAREAMGDKGEEKVEVGSRGQRDGKRKEEKRRRKKDREKS